MQSNLLSSGFERDLNNLIDLFALQASTTGSVSFATFKKLFQSAGCAYVHQAYPGCEHCPEYTQLLYATALDRLTTPRPTAPETYCTACVQSGAPFEHRRTSAGHEAASKAEQGWQTAPRGPLAAIMGQMNAVPLHPAAASQQQQPHLPVAPPPDQELHLQVPPTCDHQSQLPEQQYGHQAAVVQQLEPCHISTSGSQPLQPVNSTLSGPFAMQHGRQVDLWPAVDEHKQPGQTQLQDWQAAQQQQQLDVQAAGHGVSLVKAVADMGEDDFLADLLAILDEADTSDIPEANSDVTVTAALATADSTPSSRVTQSVVPQPALMPTSVVSLVVKAAVIFTLQCLYHTQLNQPKVCVYLPLAYLKVVQQAAAEFRAAGACWTDALLVLQSLLSEQRLLVGSFRRCTSNPNPLAVSMQPVHGAPSSAAQLTTANKALSSASTSEWRAAAVAAAARIARTSVRRVNPHYRQDSSEHREALFHLKSTLFRFNNYKSLQGLCEEYSDARRAVFEPLLRLQESRRKCPSATAAKQQQEQWQQPKKGSTVKIATMSHSHGVRLGASPTAIPELFDRGFGTDLRELVNEEAARMLVLLDPAYDASRQRKSRVQQQQQPQGQKFNAVAACRQEGQQDTSRKRRKGSAFIHAEDSKLRSQYLADMAAAGILQPSELQEVREQGADDIEAVKGMGIPQQLLRLQQEKRQRAMQVASEWFHAQDALMAHDEDEAEDMP